MAVDSAPKQHPCIGCGACCAHFRVAFYWRETEPDGLWKVPIAKVVDLDSVHRCMQGTEVKHNPKCVSLTGRIGKNAQCGIYENRPTPCRNFTASFENGTSSPRCDEARAAHGLRPLKRGDFPTRDFEK
ncbi:MAG: YkgJ family cysteine cluster protein [Bdellovibrionaceae bacterium]|nr:YkgJ family cysteine cluster protein [Pseudobdellovibrionaceae bacterium]